jgi:hypothetical protein
LGSVAEELLLPTLSARVLDRLVVLVGKPGMAFADDDWSRYVQWLKQLQQQSPRLCVLTVAAGRPPSAAQRSLVNRELKTDEVRLAVLLSDSKLVAIVKVVSWFLKSAEPFRAHEIEKALAYLGEGDPARVRTTIRELGGVVVKEAPRSAERS